MAIQVFFDLETTGFDFFIERIVSFGAVRVEDGRITDEIEIFVNPEKMQSAEARAITKIDDDFLKTQKKFAEEAPRMLAFLEGAEVICAHNGARFDIPFLNVELERAGFSKVETKNFVDSIHLARRRLPTLRSFSLDNLASHFGLSLAERESKGHGALLDSKILAQVYAGLEKIAFNEEFENWEETCDKKLANWPTAQRYKS